MKHLLQCVIFLLMAVYANATIASHSGGGTGTQSVYFAESSSTIKMATLTQSARGEFSLDVIYHDDVSTVSTLAPELHWDSRVLEYVGVSNVNSANNLLANPPTLAAETVGRFNRDDGNPDTDMVILPIWSINTGSIFDSSPVRLFTITFRWKEAASQTDLTFTHTGANDFNADHFDGTSLTIRTIPTAPTGLIATAGTVVDTIDLSWSAPVDAACVTHASTPPHTSPCITAYTVEYSTNGGSSWGGCQSAS